MSIARALSECQYATKFSIFVWMGDVLWIKAICIECGVIYMQFKYSVDKMLRCFVSGCVSVYKKKTSVDMNYFWISKIWNKIFHIEKTICKTGHEFDINSHICDKHFSDELLIKSDLFVLKGEKVEIPRSRWILKPG